MLRLSIKLGVLLGLLLIIFGTFSLFISTTPSLAAIDQDFHLQTNSVDRAAPLAQLPDIEISIDEIVASGIDKATHATTAGDGTGRLYVTTQDGMIWVVEDGQESVFMDMSGRVYADSEMGLLSIAFPPGYNATNGHFYVFYTSTTPPVDEANNIYGDTVISRFQVTNGVADPNSEQELLRISQEKKYHKGGQLAFGPDGYLYIGTGDDASSSRPQRVYDYKGKILRIDVETGNPLTYTIPASNPFTNTTTYPDHLREIWALGLRQPWRFSFDRANGDLYIGDVGDKFWEEVDYEPANSPGGVNYGWRCFEGFAVNYTGNECSTSITTTMTFPIAVYDHSSGSAAVTGGYVYRGTQFPDMQGRYFYADYSSGRIFSMYKTGPDSWSTPEEELNIPGMFFVSFAEGEDGELYVFNRGDDTLRRLTQLTSASPDLATSTKTASQPNADPGEIVTYTIQLNNTGPLTNDTFFLTDTLPAGLSYVPASLEATQGSVNDTQSPTLRWQGQLSPTSSVIITYRVTVGDVEGSLVNNAQVSGGGVALTLMEDIFVPKPKLLTTIDDFFLPGTQPHALTDTIPSPSVCGACHTEPIYNKWRGSMMSQAGRDPLMWTALSVANNDAPGAGDYCLRCHAPKGWLEGRSHPADGSALQSIDISAGVACEVCHRMVDPVPSTTDEAVAIDATVRAALTTTVPTDHVGAAMMIIDPVDNRRGPFSVVPPHSAFRTDFLGQASNSGGSNNYLTVSRMCGTCHNVDNPALSWDDSRQQFWPNDIDQPAPNVGKGQLFPIERTFDEWSLSEYASTGVYAPQLAGAKSDGIVGACQDCHMRRSTGTAASGGVNRDCVTTGCLPEHVFVGGNAWVPQILQDSRWRLKPGSEEIAGLNTTITEAREMLKLSATMTATLVDNGSQKMATVRVINETGHKLPTGYPEGRRMWLNLKAYDSNGSLIYESGAYDQNTGVLTKDAEAKIYEAKLGITPELAPIVDLPAGESFHFVLNNTYIKDNRIPPRGYTQATFAVPGLQPVGATYADGQYWDDTTYQVPATTAYIEATLYYQTSSKEYIDFLRTNGGVDGSTLGMLWDTSKSPPETVAFVNTQKGVYLPLIQKN